MAKNILIVDDSSTTRSLIASNFVVMDGFNTLEAGSGFEALKLLPNHEIDLIITDVNMPDINGLELINFVKEHPVYKNIPFIIITTERGEEDRRRGLALGAKEYLVKPFRSEDLQRIVKKIFKK